MVANLRKKPARPTDGEKLFDEYLQAQGLRFEVEPSIPGTAKRPDRRFDILGKTCLFEVKDVEAGSTTQEGVYDVAACEPLRRKMQEARRKLRRTGIDCPFCVVIYDCMRQAFPKEFWFGAMLGDFGLSWIPFVPDSTRNVFLNANAPGSMFDPKTHRIQNTRVSALLAIEKIRHMDPASHQEFVNQSVNREPGQERAIEWIKYFRQEKPAFCSHVRVRVFDNPFAKHPLPPGFPGGDYDERWNFHNRIVSRTYCGQGIKELENSGVGYSYV